MITIELVTAPTDDVRALISELDAELSQHYADAQRHGLSLDAIFQAHVRFFIARLGGGDGKAAGCGGVALFDQFAEIKRMFVRPDFRGRGRRGGVADAIIARLEAEARESGRSLVRLETGDRQLAAIGFYRRHGYRECAAFEQYAAMPPHAIATSVFMEKRV